MMWCFNGGNCVVAFQEKTRKVRNILNFVIVSALIVSFIHLLYFGFLMVDDSLFRYCGVAMGHVVSLFGFDYTDYSSYLIVSKILLFAVAPLVIISNLTKVLDENYQEAYQKHLENEQEKAKRQAKMDYIKQLDRINKYSICLSLDYEQKNLNYEAKKALNNKIFSVIDSHLKENLHLDFETSYDDAYIVMSKDFKNYDRIYACILKVLSTMKSKVEEKYSLKLIPSVTTDAYTVPSTKALIVKRHNEIKKLNFRNRACNTETFSKKYRYLKQNKFAGVPVGMYSNNFETKYDLNIVYKDLSKTLNK